MSPPVANTSPSWSPYSRNLFTVPYKLGTVLVLRTWKKNGRNLLMNAEPAMVMCHHSHTIVKYQSVSVQFVTCRLTSMRFLDLSSTCCKGWLSLLSVKETFIGTVSPTSFTLDWSMASMFNNIGNNTDWRQLVIGKAAILVSIFKNGTVSCNF